MNLGSITAHVPYLDLARNERLVYLSGQLAKANVAAAKIMLHGYYSYDPTNPAVVVDREGFAHPDNQSDLERTLGDVLAGIQMLVNSGDLVNTKIYTAKRQKLASVKKWMHHQQELAFRYED